MDFIFMLTRQDRTIADCLDVVDAIRPHGLHNIGFKDVGVPPDVLETLNARIRESGATSWMEVVSTGPDTVLQSVRVGARIGVDRLLGGTQADAVLPILSGTRTRYLPFPGRPEGHPTKLGGSPELVEAHCRSFREQGCCGADLLAYRATEADPLALVRAARRGLGTDGMLVVAGSIAHRAQVHALAEEGVDAFTIGSAVFEGSYAPHLGSLGAQLAAVLADCASAPRVR